MKIIVRLLESTVYECVFYQAIAGDSSGTRTLRLHATRSLSVAISLRGALLCIWRTPSICPLRLRPTLGGEETSVGELTDPTHTNQTLTLLLTVLQSPPTGL